LSLAWLIAQQPTNAIAGAGNAEQASQNAKAAEVKLSVEELQEIDANKLLSRMTQVVVRRVG
jgi:aryl-alcohol dehydrogenase-like predicted oxidoreductase